MPSDPYPFDPYGLPADITYVVGGAVASSLKHRLDGMRRARIHYANDLAANVAQQYGQVRVQRASDRGALAATYVKVYAKQKNGVVAFYKDGYTDLRGWFDYATLSTDDLDRVDRFAILVSSDAAGSAILEAPPPMR